MPYQALVVDPTTPAKVKRLIEMIERHSFCDVHTMLRLPIANYRLSAGCNFAIAHILLAVVGGISATLYRQGRTDGERFKGLLRDHYPWYLEPQQNVSPDDAARVLYEVFRNPLVHDLGLDLSGKSKGLKVKVKRLGRSPANGLTEKSIERLETSSIRLATMSPAIVVRSDKMVLLVEAFYWGLRRMLELMTQDRQLVQSAEIFLASRI